MADEIYDEVIAVRVLMFQGLVAGTVPLTAVKKVHKILRSKMGERLPVDFTPMKKLYTMAQNPPSLKQLATTKIRRQMTECGGGSFCKEDFQDLEIPECLKEWVQLAGLVEGSKELPTRRRATTMTRRTTTPKRMMTTRRTTTKER